MWPVHMWSSIACKQLLLIFQGTSNKAMRAKMVRTKNLRIDYNLICFFLQSTLINAEIQKTKHFLLRKTSHNLKFENEAAMKFMKLYG